MGGSRRVLGIVGLVALAATGLAYVWTALEPARPAAVEVPRPEGDRSSTAPAPAPAAPLLAPPSAAPGAPVAADPSPSGPSARAEALERGARLRGRLVRPLGAPPEPDLALRVRGRVGREPFDLRAVLDAADHFDLEVPPGARRANLELDGARYLHLDRAHSVDLGDVPAEIVLEARLGGRLLVRLVPPTGVPAAELEGARISLWGSSGAEVSRRAQADAEARASFDALPIGTSLRVDVSAEGFVESGGTSVGVRAGEEVETELTLERGVRLAGRVIDPQGEPIPQASLDLHVTLRNSSWSSGSFGRSDEGGHFDLRGVRAGTIALKAVHPRYVEASLELGELEPGAERLDLVLTLGSGASIAGRVTWPDGSPAAEVWVAAEVASDGIGWVDPDAVPRAKTGADGGFELQGLEGGAVALRATARPRRELQERLAEAGHLDAPGLRRPQLLARLENVPVGAVGVELVLRVGETLRGRVVDERGQPFERAQVLVERAGEERALRSNLRNVRDPQGFFEFEGFAPGSYVVRASGGAGPGAALEVELPLLGAGPVLTAPRGSRVVGRVRAGGTPVQGASVSLTLQNRSYSDSHSWSFHGDFDQSARSDAQGRFEFAHVPLGKHSLSAERAGLGRSPRVSLSVEALVPPGEVTLDLDVPGWIEGRLAADVEPRAARRVTLRDGDQGGWQEERADADGRFRFPDLVPGVYVVTLMGAADDEHWREVSSATVEVQAGLGAQVVLSARDEPVRVRGRVVAGREALAGIEVQALVLGRHEQGMRTARSDGEGRFELELPAAGQTRFVFRTADGDVAQERQVPAQPVVELSFELPLGRVAGRVFGRDGSPAAHVGLTLAPTADHDWSALRQVRADGEGRFAFGHVGPGTYRVSAGGGGRRYGDPPAGTSREVDLAHGLQVGEPFDLAVDQRREDLRLVLPRPASLGGAVRGRSSVGDLWIQATLQELPSYYVHHQAVRANAYHLRGLGPGTYVVDVRSAGPQHRSWRRTVTLAEGADVIFDIDLD